jgi:hypothetical protein
VGGGLFAIEWMGLFVSCGLFRKLVYGLGEIFIVERASPLVCLGLILRGIGFGRTGQLESLILAQNERWRHA